MILQVQRLQSTIVSPGLLVIQRAGGGLIHCSIIDPKELP
jgi:hypothetical protein